MEINNLKAYRMTLSQVVYDKETGGKVKVSKNSKYFDKIKNLNFIGIKIGKGNNFKIIYAYDDDTLIDDLSPDLYRKTSLNKIYDYELIPIDIKKINHMSISEYLKENIYNDDIKIPSELDVLKKISNSLKEDKDLYEDLDYDDYDDYDEEYHYSI